ncbi:hypothetical protein AB0C91_17810 [Streptomyces sp. NPDC048674]|uniref:hypothetical protein n=1 Tax=Streptomyces sp. NPDC048674 TaxID=3155491 RepID=UPI003417F235
MNDTSTRETWGSDVHETSTGRSDGHGRHRGPVSGRDDEASPQGRHRKPSGQPGQSGTAI